MLIMFAAVIVPGSFMMGDHTGTIESAFDYHTNDVGQLSKASVYGSYLAEDYMPRSFNLSVDRGIYTVGGQGASVSWSSDNIPDNIDEIVETELEQQTTWYLQDYTDQAENTIGCSISSSYVVDIVRGEDTKRISSDSPSIICTGVSSEATYGLPNTITMDFDSETFFALSENTKSFLTDINDRLSQDVDSSYSDSTIACGNRDYSSSEENAVDAAETDITNGFDQVSSNHPDNNEFDATASIIGPSHTFTYGTESEIFSGTQTSDYDDLGDCGCETCGTFPNTYDCNCDTEYRATVTIKPQESNLEWSIENNAQKILTESGIENPRFHVSSYTQLFQED
jgi:hypothetical protein